MAGILDFLGGAGSAFGDAASGVGGAIGDAGSALQNMAGSAVSAAQPAFSGVGNWLMGSGEYAAPEAADRRQAQINMLSKLGGTLLASGAYQTPDSRAKHLAKLGDIGSGYTADLLKQQQARLMRMQMKQQANTMSGYAKIAELQKTPEGRAALMRQTGIDNAELVSSAPPAFLQSLMLKNAAMDPLKKMQMMAVRQALASGQSGATPPLNVGATPVGATPSLNVGATPVGATPSPDGVATPVNIRDTPLFKLMEITNPVAAKAMLENRTPEAKAVEANKAKDVTDYQNIGKNIIRTINTQNDIVTAIGRANKIMEDATSGVPMPVVGRWGGILETITPYKHRADIESMIDTVKANLGFGKLEEIRAMSKTGGAVGNVSDLEQKLLASTVAGINVDMSEEQIKKSFGIIKSVLERGRRRSIELYQQKYKKEFNAKEFGGNLPTGASTSATQSPTPGYTVVNVRNSQ